MEYVVFYFWDQMGDASKCSEAFGALGQLLMAPSCIAHQEKGTVGLLKTQNWGFKSCSCVCWTFFIFGIKNFLQILYPLVYFIGELNFSVELFFYLHFFFGTGYGLFDIFSYNTLFTQKIRKQLIHNTHI